MVIIVFFVDEDFVISWFIKDVVWYFVVWSEVIVVKVWF